MTGQQFELDRFVQAQAGGVYERALRELRAGRKRGHWMWFVFPQIAALGSSPISQRYAIVSLAEARAYLRHPLLGSRLQECAMAVISADAPHAEAIFGPIDALKLRSSMTLFAAVGPASTGGGSFTGEWIDNEPEAGGRAESGAGTSATSTGAPASAPTTTVFHAVLDRYYGGVPDALTLRLLGVDAS